MVDELKREPTSEDLEGAMRIPEVLAIRFANLSGAELVRKVYNEAIEDAANFVRDLAPFNPDKQSTLLAAAGEIRTWLTIQLPKKDGENNG